VDHLLDDHAGILHSDRPESVARWLARAAQQAVAADAQQPVPIDPWYRSGGARRALALTVSAVGRS
jgi:hypothetical protein